MSDPDSEIVEDRLPPFALSKPMPLVAVPRFNRSLVAPNGERQELVGRGEAFEAFDRDEAVDGLEFRLQACGQIEIVRPEKRLSD